MPNVVSQTDTKAYSFELVTRHFYLFIFATVLDLRKGHFGITPIALKLR